MLLAYTFWNTFHLVLILSVVCRGGGGGRRGGYRDDDDWDERPPRRDFSRRDDDWEDRPSRRFRDDSQERGYGGDYCFTGSFVMTPQYSRMWLSTSERGKSSFEFLSEKA